VELMVMTEEQYDAYTHHRSAESLYAIEPSHDHAVSIALPRSQDEAAHYYVVFSRSTDGKTPLWVNADLTLQFDGLP
jgi:DNA/RNA endonuclease G (NUC1)